MKVDMRFVHNLPLMFVLGALATATQARDYGQWNERPAKVRRWFQSLMQPDHPRLSCCGEADAFEADQFEVEGDHYVAIITDGRGLMANGTRIPIPNEKMKFDNGNPTGHGIIFIGDEGQIYCYVTPSGG
jgi:hypothetical protein